MPVAYLVKDQKSNLIEHASKSFADAQKDITQGGYREYEFVFPLKNEDPGDTYWEQGKAYMLTFLVGPGETPHGVTPDTWMSDQILLRIGNASEQTIYPSRDGHGL